MIQWCFFFFRTSVLAFLFSFILFWLTFLFIPLRFFRILFYLPFFSSSISLSLSIFIDNSWYQLRRNWVIWKKKEAYTDSPKVSLNTLSYLSWQISFLVLVDKGTYLDNSGTFIIGFQPKWNKEQQNRCVLDWTSSLLYIYIKKMISS